MDDIGFSRELVVDATGGDAGLAEELIAVFLSDSAALLDAIQEAVHRGDGVATARAAHALKGAVSYFTQGAAYRAAAALEQSAGTGDLVSLAPHLHVLEHDIAVLVAAMRDSTAAADGRVVTPQLISAIVRPSDFL